MRAMRAVRNFGLVRRIGRPSSQEAPGAEGGARRRVSTARSPAGRVPNPSPWRPGGCGRAGTPGGRSRSTGLREYLTAPVTPCAFRPGESASAIPPGDALPDRHRHLTVHKDPYVRPRLDARRSPRHRPSCGAGALRGLGACAALFRHRTAGTATALSSGPPRGHVPHRSGNADGVVGPGHPQGASPRFGLGAGGGSRLRGGAGARGRT